VTVSEQIPPGFTFMGAVPEPNSVEIRFGGGDVTPGDEPFGTLVSWTFLNPAPGSVHEIHYDVNTPESPEQLGQAFANKIVQDGQVFYSAFPLDQIAIGGVLSDCNGNGIDDSVDLAMETSGDCNHNLVPDECDIQRGLSHDTNLDEIPDECAAAFDYGVACGDAEHPYPAGDLNRNCRIDLFDLAEFAGNWLECTAPECEN
jgi:hypothetical protein